MNNRNSSIELLRIITMIGVVILHYNNASMGGGFAYVQAGSLNEIWLYFTESLFVNAVDLYILISAYYLIASEKRNYFKIVYLLIQVSIFRAGFYLIGCCLGHSEFVVSKLFAFLLPNNYFAILYATLYLISPYINILIKSLDLKQLKKFVLLFVVLFSIWTCIVDFMILYIPYSLTSLSTVSSSGSQQGYTIINFILLYIIGAYIRISDIHINNKMLWAFAINTGLITGLSVIMHSLDINVEPIWYYNNPLVILNAVIVLLLFLKYNFYNRLINELSGACFTCFVFHESCLKYLKIDIFANSRFMILHQIGSAIGLFIISYFVYKIYDFVIGKILIRWIHQ